MAIVVKHYQSILDVSIEHTGSIDAFMDILYQNGISSLEVYDYPQLSVDPVNNKKVVAFFAQQDPPATGKALVGSFNQSFNSSFNI